MQLYSSIMCGYSQQSSPVLFLGAIVAFVVQLCLGKVKRVSTTDSASCAHTHPSSGPLAANSNIHHYHTTLYWGKNIRYLQMLCLMCLPVCPSQFCIGSVGSQRFLLYVKGILFVFNTNKVFIFNFFFLNQQCI